MPENQRTRPTASVAPAKPPLLIPYPPSAPLLPPVHVVDLMTAAGSAVFGARWKAMEAKLVECPALSDAMPEFKTNSATFAVGVRLEPDNRLHIEAPFGLADLFALRLVPNPYRKMVGFDRTAADVRRRRPEIMIDNEPGPNREAPVAVSRRFTM